MPEIAAAQTAADMTYAKPHAFMPTGGSNRRTARMQAAALRWLVRMAALLTAAVLVFLIGYILVMGIPNLKPELFAWEYNSENVSLTPALINTVLMTAFSLAISTPLGIFAAIWLVEYAHRGSKLVKVVRVTTETLQGIPSIVYGLFGMLFFVTKLHWGYSMIAGAFTLAIMVLPVIMRTTEEALIAVPDSYREGSFGLGAGKLRTVFTIVLPSAMPGILSGVILATGRIVGETAALIYTASSVAKIPSSVFSSTRTLAVHMYLLSNEGLYIGQTYGTAVVLLVLVLAVPAIFHASEAGPGSMHAPAIVSLLIALVVGALAQKSRLCMVGGIRDSILVKDNHLLYGFIAIFLTVLIGNLVQGSFKLGFDLQPIAHSSHLWNLLGMVLVGWGSVLLGGCPLRQLILAGSGNGDSAVTVFGMIVGAAFAHNFALAGNPDSANDAGELVVGGIANAGKVAVVIGFVVLLAISLLNSRKEAAKV